MKEKVTHKKRKKKYSLRVFLTVLLGICVTTGVCLAIHKNRLVSISLPTAESKDAETKRAELQNGEEDTKAADASSFAVQDGKWCLTLVNKNNPLQNTTSFKLVELSNGERVDQRIYPSLQKMFDAARKEGIYPIVASGYRTEKEQEKIMKDKISEYQKEGLSATEAKKEAEIWVAVPGTSEHQLGLAVDINADGVHSKGSEVYEWLRKNAYKYGFIYRYPEDKFDITGVANEPWHYRYVGIKAAKEIYERNICLEEYIEK